MQQYKLKCDTINKLNQFKMGLGVDNANVAYVQAIYNSLNNNSKINSKQPNIQHVDLKTNNLKKEIFMKAIFDAVTILPERGTLTQVLVLLKKNFSNSTGMYKISDLKLACQYLIRDRLKSQGGEAFRKLIQDIYYIFEAIEC